ncbi:Gfo/Idh/MocA family protein [Yoonia sediminilitoris]|uniref:Putative dehydrogenase n=1 Tax=Yoonia sediminilitoris TaxID=1286148 RepID=A0A2T6KQZ1_9RHOB|nr:Gfo/Idh/MocA family oxidoreductase [Yoonia sediminilitoris]PUB18955.1 putative dehydrogenase [Yoonia sediminilitoris]RCW99123.1 putative dehydrogenase [Yoonia sediminilitoris]
MGAPLAICVVGGGSIGMRHIGCAQASDLVRLSAVVEADAARRDALAAMGLPVVADIDAVPADTKAAVIATPTPNHAQVGLDCLAKGWGVLVEKPLTETLADADLLCARAAALGLPLVAGHHRRCHPFVAHARTRLQDIGDMVAVQGIWALRKHDSYYDVAWRRAPGAGPILTNLSHEIDLLHCLAGPITEVTAMNSNATRGFAVEDTSAISLRFASGALGTFILSDAGVSPWAFEAATGENPAIAVRGEDPLRFIGTAGALSFPTLQMWKGDGQAAPDWQHPLNKIAAPELPRVDAIAEQLDRFAAVVGGAEDDLIATGDDGRRTMQVLDAIHKAAHTGQSQAISP